MPTDDHLRVNVGVVDRADDWQRTAVLPFWAAVLAGEPDDIGVRDPADVLPAVRIQRSGPRIPGSAGTPTTGWTRPRCSPGSTPPWPPAGC